MSSKSAGHADSPMTAADVRDALTKPWPDDRYLHVYEAPLDLEVKVDVVKRLASLYWQVFDTETMTVVSDAHGSWSNAWNVARALNRRAVENSDG